MSDGIMIAYLPVDAPWCKQPLPHMTLVYAGTLEEHDYSDFNQLAKDAIVISRLTSSFTLDVEGVEVFGDEEKVDVLTLIPTPEVLQARDLVKHWNKSEYTEFKPHVTVGPAGSARDVLPTQIYFNRVIVSFGNENMTFFLEGRRAWSARSDY